MKEIQDLDESAWD